MASCLVIKIKNKHRYSLYLKRYFDALALDYGQALHAETGHDTRNKLILSCTSMSEYSSACVGHPGTYTFENGTEPKKGLLKGVSGVEKK